MSERMEADAPARGGPALHQLRLCLIALQFFTRIPVPAWVGYEPEWLRQASRYYPLVGLIVGGIAAGGYFLAAQCLPQAAAVLVSMAVSVYLTGAFHEDGFADVCDGFGGGYTRDRVLAIMKDSRIGAYGAIGIGLMLALKFTALASLSPIGVLACLLVAHPLSRLLSAALIWRMAYARDEGKAKPLAECMTTMEFMVAMATACVPLLAAGLLEWLSWNAIVAGLALSCLAMAWLARLFARRIGGFTGDCLGAVQQAAECAFYLGVAAALGGGAWHAA